MLKIFLAIFALLPLVMDLNAQQHRSRIDPLQRGKEILMTDSNHLMTLRPKVGDVFRYRISVKTQGSSKNSDELFKEYLTNLKQTEKYVATSTYFVKNTVRSIREDGLLEFLYIRDSLLDLDTNANSYPEFDPISNRYYADFKGIGQNMIRESYYLPVAITANPDTLQTFFTTYTVWGSFAFPAEQTVVASIPRFEEREGKVYSVMNFTTTYVPKERVLTDINYS